MQQFIQSFGSAIKGVLCGFDRIRFRGVLPLLCNSGGLLSWLTQKGVDPADFKTFSTECTRRVFDASVKRMADAGRPVEYVNSSNLDKERLAREIARRRRITEGPVCALYCVEPCMSYSIRRSRDGRNYVLDYCPRKCRFIYHYLIDPDLGWLHVRVQTWIPFEVRICLNGRRWLAQQMDRRGLAYVQRDNCFTRLEEPIRAQRLMNRQLTADWPQMLNRLQRQAHPAHRRLFADAPVDYYWTAQETEWATDFMFGSRQQLAAAYPKLLKHAITTIDAKQVMTFLGDKPVQRIHGNFKGEAMTDLRCRVEGTRIKSYCRGNSVKMYDKQGRVLRIETTINNPEPFKVRRRPHGRPKARKRRFRLAKGVADLPHRAQISDRSNQRYLEALASADLSKTVGDLTARLCRPRTYRKRRVRALRPFDPDDTKLLAAAGSADFFLSGLRNRDLRSMLFGPDSDDPAETRRRSAAISRKLRLLQAHGILRKVKYSHSYTVTKQGRQIITAILAAKSATADKLAAAA